MNFLLSVNPNQTLDLKNVLTFGGQTLLIGMGAVFSVLIIIWLCLVLLKYFLHDLPNKKSPDANEAPVPAIVTPIADSSLDGEIIAAIAAAIAMAESESAGLKFRVVSFRRK